jgi:hypothetical protein
LPAEAPFVEAFRDGLHRLGYVDGQTIIIEHRYAESKTERLRNSISGCGNQRKITSSLWLIK